MTLIRKIGGLDRNYVTPDSKKRQPASPVQGKIRSLSEKKYRFLL